MGRGASGVEWSGQRRRNENGCGRRWGMREPGRLRCGGTTESGTTLWALCCQWPTWRFAGQHGCFTENKKTMSAGR